MHSSSVIARLKPNTYYTLSFKCEGAIDGCTVGIRRNDSGGLITNVDFIKVTNGIASATIHTIDSIVSDDQVIYIGGLNKKGTFKLGRPKLELGNIATDWTPAPEDVDEGINNAQSSADKAQTNASNAQQTANNAQDTANKADAKADQAISDAASASTAAQIAKKQADAAQAKSDEANRIANGAAATISPIAQVVKVDSQGLKILNSEQETSYAQMQSTGLYVFVNKAQRSVFGVTSKTENLAVQDYLMFGAHRAEMRIEDGEEGTALFHVGGIK